MTFRSIPIASVRSIGAPVLWRDRRPAVRPVAHCLAAVLLALCVAADAAAQTVRGRVEFRNGYPAAGAAVRVINSQRGPSGYAYTGYDGMYYLYGIPAGDYELQVSMNGQLVLRQPIRVFPQPGTDLPPYLLPW